MRRLAFPAVIAAALAVGVLLPPGLAFPDDHPTPARFIDANGTAWTSIEATP